MSGHAGSRTYGARFESRRNAVPPDRRKLREIWAFFVLVQFSCLNTCMSRMERAAQGRGLMQPGSSPAGMPYHQTAESFQE
jgi:hypothetical protein